MAEETPEPYKMGPDEVEAAQSRAAQIEERLNPPLKPGAILRIIGADGEVTREVQFYG